MDHFLTSLFITILLLFLFGFFGHEACGISAPWPGIEPVPSTLEDKVSATGPAESPYLWVLSLPLLSEFPKHIYVLFLFLYYWQRLSGIREWDHGSFFVFLFVLPHTKKKKKTPLINVIYKKKYRGQDVRGATFPCVNDKAFIQHRH